MEEQFKDFGKLVKDGGLEQPSAHFVSAIMDQITPVSESSIVYTPLIGKNTWRLIGVCVVLFLGYTMYFSGTAEPIFSFKDISIFKLSEIKNPLAAITNSKTTLYGVTFLAILLLVHILYLKRRIDKSFAI